MTRTTTHTTTSLTTALGALEVITLTGSQPGPTVWMVGGIHGDEPSGVMIARDVARAYTIDYELCGTVHICPAVNGSGLANTTRHTAEGRDLNRLFGGPSDTSASRVLAEQLFERIVSTNPALVIDLHGDWQRSIPYIPLDYNHVLANIGDTPLADAALASDLLVVTENSVTAPVMMTTLSGALIGRGFAAVTLEVGPSRDIDEINQALVRRAIDRLLTIAGTLVADQKPAPQRRLYEYDEITAPVTGLISWQSEPGQEFRAGDILAEIHDNQHSVSSNVEASCNGIIISQTDTSQVVSGDPIIAIAH